MSEAASTFEDDLTLGPAPIDVPAVGAIVSELGLDESALHEIFSGYLEQVPDRALAEQVIEQAGADPRFLELAYRSVLDALVVSSAATFFIDDADFGEALRTVRPLHDEVLARMRREIFEAGIGEALASEDARLDPTLASALARRAEFARTEFA